jgi:hypothetical protein
MTLKEAVQAIIASEGTKHETAVENAAFIHFAEVGDDVVQQLYRIANALERMANAAEQGTPDLAAMSQSIFGGLGEALAAAQADGEAADG